MFEYQSILLSIYRSTDGIENKEDLSSPIHWKAIFKIADKVIPLIFKLDSVPLNVYGYRAIFVDGPQTNQKEIVQIKGDSIPLELDYFGKLNLKGVIHNQKYRVYFKRKRRTNNLKFPLRLIKRKNRDFQKPQR